MAIVKNLVDIMKGTIEVDSMVNVGTKVIVTLPLEVATQTQEVTVQEKNTMQYTYPGKHILIVEDKRINMEIVKGFLEDTELIIDEARNGKEALEKVEASREGTYDLIFMDAAKGQYIHWLPDVVRLLAPGGILLSDNVLQEGELIESHYLVERRNRTIYKRMREYLYELKHHPQLLTSIVPLGDGISLSVKQERGNYEKN